MQLIIQTLKFLVYPEFNNVVIPPTNPAQTIVYFTLRTDSNCNGFAAINKLKQVNQLI